MRISYPGLCKAVYRTRNTLIVTHCNYNEYDGGDDYNEYQDYIVKGIDWTSNRTGKSDIVNPCGRHFPDDIFKCIFLNENVLISIKISLQFVPEGPINNIPALV